MKQAGLEVVAGIECFVVDAADIQHAAGLSELAVGVELHRAAVSVPPDNVYTPELAVPAESCRTPEIVWLPPGWVKVATPATDNFGRGDECSRGQKIRRVRLALNSAKVRLAATLVPPVC